MSKEKFDRSSRTVNIGTIGHVIMGRQRDGSVTKILQKAQSEDPVRSFDSIDNAPEEKVGESRIATPHVEYEDEAGTTRTWTVRDTPTMWKHDHGGGADGWGDIGGGRLLMSDAADARAHPAGRGQRG